MKQKLLRMMSGIMAFAVMMCYSAVPADGVKAAGGKGVKKVIVANVQGKKITIGKGKKLKLVTTVVRTKGSKVSKKVSFNSSNQSVVSVSKKGVITARKLGKAKISICSKANPKKKVTIKVTVAKKSVAVKKISLKKKLTLYLSEADDSEDEDEEEDIIDDSDDDEVEEDEEEDEDDEYEDEEEEEFSYSLKAKVSPSNASNQTLTWSSSNKKVVTVDKYGNITVVNAGKAVVTVKAADGSKKKAKCNITVIDDLEEEGDDSEEE